MLSIKRHVFIWEVNLASFILWSRYMRTVTCNECGCEIAEDDFISQHCPVCDSFMPVSRLNLKVDSDLGAFVRIDNVPDSALVERD